jgi:sugar lactone lactonase YvrE
MLACIGRLGAKDWIAGAESGVFRLSPKAGGELGFDRLASVTHAQAGMRFNDGRCDRQGRFLAGTMVMDMAAGARVGSIYSYQGWRPQGAARGFHHAQRHGLQPGRPHHVPVRLAPFGAVGLGL